MIPEQARPTQDEPVEASPPQARSPRPAPAKKAARKAAATRQSRPTVREPIDSEHPTETTETQPTTTAETQPATTATTPALSERPSETEATTTAQGTDERPLVVATRPPARTPAEAEARSKPPTDAWAKLIADPGHAPELLALAAVQTTGPRAAEWARRNREAYPTATTQALARLAERQFVRFGGVAGLFAAATGSYVPVALLGSNAITFAELILHVAAAYGFDPTDRQRAIELLVLTQVHATAEDAEAALSTAEQPAYEEDTTLTDAVWRLGRMASAQAATWTLIKGINKLYPGTTVLTALITSRSAARTMGVRAVHFYRQLSQSRPDQSQFSQESGSRV